MCGFNFCRTTSTQLYRNVIEIVSNNLIQFYFVATQFSARRAFVIGPLCNLGQKSSIDCSAVNIP